MLSYCLKCKKNTESINPRVSKTSNGKTMILSKCAICGSKKSKFIKKQEARGILSSVGIRAPSIKIPVLGDILFSKEWCIKIMLSYCLKCGENAKSAILQVSRAINGGIIISSKCVVCGDKKSKFVKKQKATLLLIIHLLENS